MIIVDKYEKHKLKFLKMLEELEVMWNDHLGRMTTSRHRIELICDDFPPVQSVSYRDRPSAYN